MEAQVPWLDVEGAGTDVPSTWSAYGITWLFSMHIPMLPKNSVSYEVPQELYQGTEFELFGCIVGTGKCIGFCGVLVGHYSR